jgi:hypothetical protein
MISGVGLMADMRGSQQREDCAFCHVRGVAAAAAVQDRYD